MINIRTSPHQTATELFPMQNRRQKMKHRDSERVKQTKSDI